MALAVRFVPASQSPGIARACHASLIGLRPLAGPLDILDIDTRFVWPTSIQPTAPRRRPCLRGDIPKHDGSGRPLQ